jgi:serine/threonine protein kinase
MYDSFVESKYRFIVLEYCPGGSLAEKLAAGPLAREELFSACVQLISALRACHSVRVAHSDLKPQNILLNRQGRLKLADFGLANVHQGDLSSQFKGSLAYIAPEVLRHELFDPFKADVWSLGVTFYVMATGKLPWPENLRSSELYDCIVRGLPPLGDSIPHELASLLPQMVVPDPAQRLSIDQVDPRQFLPPEIRRVPSRRWSGDGGKGTPPVRSLSLSVVAGRSRKLFADGMASPLTRASLAASRAPRHLAALPVLRKE